MAKDYIVRLYQPGDDEGIVELLNQVFDGWPHLDLECSSTDHWRWKYLDNPLKVIFVALAIRNNRIIGCHHAIPLKIKLGGRSVLCATAVDFAVHSDFRRIGVSKSVDSLNDEELRKAGIQLCYYITDNPIIIEGEKRRGTPRFPAHILNLVRINDIDKQLHAMPMNKAWLIKLGFKTAKLLNSLRNAMRGPKYPKSDFNVSIIDGFRENINKFWETVSGHYDFIVERSREHLNWRYCDQRGSDFKIKQVEQEGEVLGYIVLRINKYVKYYPIGYIVDLLTLPDRLDVANALVSDAVRYFDRNGVNIINYQVVSGSPYEKILKRRGFLDSRIKIQLFYTLYGEQDYISGIKGSSRDVFLSWGDHDVLPVKIPMYK